MVLEIDDEEEDAEKLEAFEVVEVVEADRDIGIVFCTDVDKFRRDVGEDDDDRVFLVCVSGIAIADWVLFF